MSAVMEELEKLITERVVRKEHIEKIQKMIKREYTKDEILELGYTEEEYIQAEGELLELLN